MVTASQYLGYLNSVPSTRAFLDTIAWAEGGRYNNMFGGGTFSGNQHPNRCIPYRNTCSTAAGRYQFLYRTWIEIKNRLGLPDFSPINQDIAALELIRQRGQLNNLLNNRPEAVMRGLGCAWAALPFSGCGQTSRPLAATLQYYNGALRALGGSVAANQIINSSQAVNLINSSLPVAALSADSEYEDYTQYALYAGAGLLLLLVLRQ